MIDCTETDVLSLYRCMVVHPGEVHGAPQELEEAVLQLTKAVRASEEKLDAAEEEAVSEAERLVAVHALLQERQVEVGEAYKAALEAQQARSYSRSNSSHC